jgi:LemA protein
MMIVGLVLLAIALLVIFIYNQLVTLRQSCAQGAANIDVQLKQRRDLVPNLVETVKGYAAHESTVLNQVIAARNAASQAASPADAARAEGGLSAALSRLLALAEAYPDLKASANFQTLQTELAEVEDKLAAARRAMNGAVAGYNSARQAFPAVLFASALGFAPAEFWDLEPDERGLLEAPPSIKF